MVFLLRPVLAALTALALAALLSPFAAAKIGIENPDASTPVQLYMHLIDFQDFPINTQKPDDKWTQSTAVGLLTSTTSCLPETPAGTLTSQSHHTFYGYSSPSYVEYSQLQNGKPRVHPERGISYDAELDPAVPFTLYWYMSTQNVAAGLDGLPDPNSVPVVVPNVVVRATIRAGDAISVDDRAYNTGEVLVAGETEPATIVMDQAVGPSGAAAANVKPLGQVGEQWLFEFAVPMVIEKPIIPRSTGYNLRVDVYMDNPYCTDPSAGALMPNLVRIHSSADFRPRMEFAVLNPIEIRTLHPQFVGDDLVIHTVMNSVWGNYDVAEVSTYTPDVTADDLQFTIDGPSPAPGLYRAAFVQNTNPHYQHQNDVAISYVWPYKLDRAADGLYTVTVRARNDQQTAEAVASATFEVGKGRVTGCDLNRTANAGADVCTTQERPTGGPERGSPAPGFVGVAAAVAAALAIAAGRRRRAER